MDDFESLFFVTIRGTFVKSLVTGHIGFEDVQIDGFVNQKSSFEHMNRATLKIVHSVRLYNDH
jgi:hypothetical protein